MSRCHCFRSIGVSNFNVHHLEGLKKACPDHIPTGSNTIYQGCRQLQMFGVLKKCGLMNTHIYCYFFALGNLFWHLTLSCSSETLGGASVPPSSPLSTSLYIGIMQQHCLPSCTVNQIELHPFLDREKVVSYCEQEGIVVEAYSPITQGKKLGDPTIMAIAKKWV